MLVPVGNLHFVSTSFSKLHAVDTENLKMLYKVSFYLGITVLLASCAGSNKATTKKQIVQSNSATDVCDKSLQGNAPHIGWYKKTDDVFKGMPNAVMLPAMHDVYAVDSQELHAFFYAAKAGNVETAIPLVNGIGCKVFTLKESGAMNEELRKKYPDMISLQGGESGTNNGDVRLDYNGRAIQAQIILDGTTYILKPIYVRNTYYYVMYRKEDTQPNQPLQESVVPKKPLPPQAPQQIKYDR
jgi:hypothetical protein